MTSKPRLLYLSPVVPHVTGHGLAMRAGMVLQALAERYCISLLVVPPHAPSYTPYAPPIPAAIATLCHQTAVVTTGPTTSRPSPLMLRPLLKWCGRSPKQGLSLPDERVTQAGKAFRDVPFDVVHVFRLSMLPFARPYLGTSAWHRPQRHLDLDDIESITRRRLAALYRLNGNSAMARLEEAEAERYEALEDEVLRYFDRVYVCSEGDKEKLQRRSRAQLCVLPNAVRIPGPLAPKQGSGPFTFLFVGTLDYYPNEDALRYFCTEVVPLIRQMAPRDFRVTIVGIGATDALQRLTCIPEVRLIGAVPDVAPWYRDADVVVVPIRAGGGTRIKVLEAFSYRRPVVSTSIGIEGIDARDAEHVLVGDTPDALAEHCVRLMTDPDLAELLTGNAFSLFMRAYTIEAVTRTLAACSSPRPRREWRSDGGSPAPT